MLGSIRFEAVMALGSRMGWSLWGFRVPPSPLLCLFYFLYFCFRFSSFLILLFCFVFVFVFFDFVFYLFFIFRLSAFDLPLLASLIFTFH